MVVGVRGIAMAPVSLCLQPPTRPNLTPVSFHVHMERNKNHCCRMPSRSKPGAAKCIIRALQFAHADVYIMLELQIVGYLLALDHIRLARSEAADGRSDSRSLCFARPCCRPPKTDFFWAPKKPSRFLVSSYREVQTPKTPQSTALCRLQA